MKKYILIAGVNGSGKSTLYYSRLPLQEMPRVNSAEIAKERVKKRVEEGGHGIPEKDIERRYVETFKNLREVLPYCNKAVFYDNSEKFQRFALYENGKFLRISEEVPEWFEKYVI